MTTYYASHNAAGGGSGTIGSPFTSQEIADAVTAGNLGLWMNTGTYAPTATLDFDTNSGSASSKVTHRGCASGGTDDGTMITIDGSSLSGAVSLLNLANTKDHLVFENMHLTAGKLYNIYSDSNNTIYKNVRLSYAASHGFWQQTNIDYTSFADCEVDHNAGAGIYGPFSSRGTADWLRCSIHHNGSWGLNLIAPGSAINCLVYANGSYGIRLDSSAGSVAIEQIIDQCTIFGNSGGCIYNVSASNAGRFVVRNTILHGDTTGRGLYSGGTARALWVFKNNLHYNNFSGATDLSDLGLDVLNVDPGFASVTSGSEDFTPSNSALMIAQVYPTAKGGVNYRWIGAIQPTSSGGGPSGLPVSRMVV